MMFNKRECTRLFLAFFICFLASASMEIYMMPKNVIANTHKDLLNRQEFNTIAFTEVMFDASIDPRSEGFTAPQNDTLYGAALFDVRQEPVVLVQGDVDEGRYWVHELVNERNEVVNYIGAYSDAYKSQTYLITGKSFDGNIPAGIDRVVETNAGIVWDLYRIYAKDKNDFKTADSQRRNVKVYTLSDYLTKTKTKTK